MSQRLKRSLTAFGVVLAATLIGPLAGPQAAQAAVATSVGTHFWINFSDNAQSPSGLTVFIAAEAATSGTVKAGGVTYPFSVSSGAVTSVSVPTSMRVTDSDGISSKGIEVTAVAPVSVYGLNSMTNSSGGFLALPTSALGTSYRVLAAPGAESPQMSVVATVDNTTVTITPQTTVGARNAGIAYTQTLNTGQTYQLQAPSGPDILSGTTVTADHPIAVFGGASCGNIPDPSVMFCDHLVQQMTPADAWGKQFLAMPFATRSNGDFYRVLAHESGTAVSVNGSVVATLNAGELYEDQIATPTVQITSSKPVLVGQFANGTGYDSTLGDPLMMLVPPAGQYLSNYTISAPNVGGFSAYATVIAPLADVGQVTMDGVAIAANLFTPIGMSGYSGASFSVTSAAHRFAGPHGFGLQVYEWGSTDGFGFPGGMAVAPIANAGPPPVAAPLTSSGGGAQTATATVPVGATIVLVDGNTTSNTVTVNGQGVYTLDPATGIITFTPDNGYNGSPTPVTYRLTDSYNQSSSNTYSPTVAAVAPGTPGTPTAVAGDGQVAVTITAPSTGGTPVTYTVRVVGDATKFCTVTVPATSCTVTGLTNTTSYTFESRATNATGDSSWSAASTAVAPALAVPGTPGTPVAVLGDERATVTITTPVSGGVVASYTVRVAGDATKSCTVTVPATSCTVTGLTNGTPYTFESRAINTAGTSSWSPASNSVTPVRAAPGTPGTPTTLAGSGVVQVTITAPSTGGPTASYTVRVVGDATKFCTITVPATSCSIDGLTNGTAYTFESRATNTGGSSGWSAASSSVTPMAPPTTATPGAATATAGVASVTAGWTAVPGATSYVAYASPGAGSCTASAPSTSCVIGATAGTSYTVRVVARGPNGDSAQSSPSGPVTPTEPVPPATVPDDVPLTLTTDKGQLSLALPSQQITVIGTGFAPYSTAKVTLYSTPIDLGTVTTDGAGSFSVGVTVPADIAAGEHTFLAVGVDAQGASRKMALPVTVPPTSPDSTGPGDDTQDTVLPVPSGGGITLLDADGNPATTVTIAGQGTYALDATTGTITFVAVTGFTGTATAVKYRITDSIGTVVNGTYTAVVTEGGDEPPGPAPSTGSISVRVPKLTVTRGNPARATVPIVVAFSSPIKGRNTLVLWSTVQGKRVNLGYGRSTMTVASRRAAITVTLNPLGRALAARPGGYLVAAAVTTTPDSGRTLRGTSRTRLVLNQFTVARPVYFGTASSVISAAQVRYLRSLRPRLTGVRSITCVGHTDDRGSSNAARALGERRARAVCRTLAAGLKIRTYVITKGETNPTGNNKTPAGMARNRRADITIRY